MMDDSGRSLTRCSACGGMHSTAEACPTGHGARVGTVLEGKYEIVRLLGHGGMGEVYEGRHTRIGRRVAVKFLHAHYAQHTEVARRFENEAKTAGAAEHENIAAVYDVGVLPDRSQYLVMEYLDGEDLDHVLQREGRLPVARAADVLMQACLGLDVVHRVGIVHRDLKPANLFMTRRASGADQVKVLDFGIAKLRRVEGDVGATKTGVALGTAYYMSPEQARGERDIGPASDIYALGVILYELLAGQRPHEGDSLLQILHRILTVPPKPLEETAPGLPPAMYAIVRRAMATNPEDRFRGVGELAQALGSFAAGARTPSQLPPAWATRPETAGPMAGPSASSPTPGPPWSGSPGTMIPVGQTAPGIPGVPGPKGMVIGLVIAGFFVVAIAAATVVALAARAHRAAATSVAAGASSSMTLPSGTAASTASLAAAAASATVVVEAGMSPPPVTTTTTAPPLPPAPRTGGTPRPPPGAAPPPAPPAPVPQSNCEPPYYYNAKGTRVFKPECL